MLAFASDSMLWATDKPLGLSVKNDAKFSETHNHKFLRSFFQKATSPVILGKTNGPTNQNLKHNQTIRKGNDYGAI